MVKQPMDLKKAAEQEPSSVSFWYIALLVSFSLGTGATTACVTQALQKSLASFNTSVFFVGLLTSFMSLNQIWATPYAAWKSDHIWTRIGRRKPVVLAMGPVLIITLLLVPYCPSLVILSILVFVLTVALSTQLALITPSIGDSVPDKQRPLATAMWHLSANGLANFFMARYVFGLMDPGIHKVGINIFGWQGPSITLRGAEHWPYTVAAVIFTITSLLFLRVMRERYVPPRSDERFKPFTYSREIVQVREHLLIYIVLLFQPLFVLVGSWYFLQLATKEMGMSMAQYGSANSWGAIAVMITCIPFGCLFNRVRHRKVFTIIACLLALIPTTYGLFFMRNQAGMAFFFASQQFAFAIFRMNFFPYVIEYTTPKSVGTILGFTNAVNGIVRFTMVPLCGILVDLAGKNYRLPLWGGYIGVAVCIIMVLAMRPPEKVRHLLDAGERA